MKNIIMPWILLVILTFSAAPAPALAQDEASKGEEWLLQQISNSLGQDTKIDSILQQLRRTFYASDVDGGGVSARDYALIEQIEQARARSEMFKRWAEWDLDNDGKVTRAELELYFGRQARQALSAPGGLPLFPTKEQSAEILTKLTEDALAWDFNHDGAITLAEIRQAANEAWAKRSNNTYSYASRQLVPLSLDSNNDKTVSLAEFEAAARLLLNSIDRNGDGKISADEAASLRDQLNTMRKRRPIE